MKLIRGQHNFKHPMQSVVTIGNFDGLHKGHQRLIDALIKASKAFKLPSVLLTFEPHPREFFSKDKSVPRLMRFREKWDAIKQCGVDTIYCLHFDAQFAALSPEKFVQTVLVKQLGVKEVIVGDDFRFGKKRVGDCALLIELGKQYGFNVQALPQSMHEEKRISSSRVRDALDQGDFELAKMLTDRPFRISGKVAYGDQMGRKLGFPTANIHLRHKQVPLMGIFVVQVFGLRDVPLPAVASIGYRPTFGGNQIMLEVYMFGFDHTIYGRRITVEFLKKIRDEKKFDSIPELVTEIEKDVEIAKRYFQMI